MRRLPGGAAGRRLMMSGPPATTNDLGEFRLVSNASAAGPQRGAMSGLSSGIGDGIAGGPAYMTVTINGVTTQYRFEAETVAVEIQNDHVSGVRVTAKQPR